MRREGDVQAWHCSGKLTVNTDAKSWLDKNVVTMDRERIANVQITHPDGEVLTVGRAAPEDAQYMLDHTTGHGFWTGSSTERLPIERAVLGAAKEFAGLRFSS